MWWYKLLAVGVAVVALMNGPQAQAEDAHTNRTRAADGAGKVQTSRARAADGAVGAASASARATAPTFDQPVFARPAPPTVRASSDSSRECRYFKVRALGALIAEVNHHNVRQLALKDPTQANLRLGGRICLTSVDSLLQAFRALGIGVVEKPAAAVGSKRPEA